MCLAKKLGTNRIEIISVLEMLAENKEARSTSKLQLEYLLVEIRAFQCRDRRSYRMELAAKDDMVFGEPTPAIMMIAIPLPNETDQAKTVCDRVYERNDS